MSMSQLDSNQCIKTAFNDTLGALTVTTVGNEFSIEVQGASYSHISANGTTTVKSGSGVLANISINTAGASSNRATVYDNTAGSGTVIAVIDTNTIRNMPLNIAFTTGLTIVVATGTAADITVSYY